MSRHNYVDDCDFGPLELGRYRGRVASAIRGRRGQQLLHDLAAALDAMPERKLGTHALLSTDGEVCALGCVMRHRGLTIQPVNLNEEEVDVIDTRVAAKTLGVSEVLACEIAYLNDEGWGWDLTPKCRWSRMRKWVQEQIAKETP